MTEYDYSEEGRRRYIATQNRIAKWVHHTESSSQLMSPFSPPSRTGSRPSTTHFSHGPMTSPTHQTYRHSHAPHDSPFSLYDLPSHVYPASSQSSSSSRSGPASTMSPSDSISQAQAPVLQMPMHQFHRSSSSHHSSHHTHPSSHRSSHAHHAHHRHRAPTYIISPPPPPSGHAYRAPGVIILPRPGRTPQVVFY